MDSFCYEPGDVLETKGAWFPHVGIYLGGGLVAHNSWSGGPHISTLETFGDGDSIKVIQRPLGYGTLVAQRAEQEVSRKQPYNPFTYNCEHFVTFALTGERKSAVVDVLRGLALVGIVCFVVARAR